MRTPTWTKKKVEDPVALADLIELNIALGESDSNEFKYADFLLALRGDNTYSEEGEEYPREEDDDEYKEYLENAIALMENRKDWLGELYPFTVSKGEAKFEGICNHQKGMPYLFLLGCAHYTEIHHERLCSKNLPVEFENICKEAMKTLFSEYAEVLLFSQFSNDRKERFGRSAKEAVKELARMLNTEIKDEPKIPEVQNEFGIDIIAVDQTEDKLGIPFFAFAQCSIGSNWPAKRAEAQIENGLNAYINVGTRHSNFMFIPYLPRTAENKWDVSPHSITNCILYDRYRICKMIQRLEKLRDRSSGQQVNIILEKFYQSCRVSGG